MWRSIFTMTADEIGEGDVCLAVRRGRVVGEFVIGKAVPVERDERGEWVL